MPIIDTTYFWGEIAIAQIEDTVVASNLTKFIAKYEPIFLRALLGRTLGDASPLEDKLLNGDTVAYLDGYIWPGLKDRGSKTSPIANYVYYHWMKNEYSATMGGGEQQLKSQNAVNYNPAQKMIRAWNEMVDWNWELDRYVTHYSSVYSSYRTEQNLYRKLNPLFF